MQCNKVGNIRNILTEYNMDIFIIGLTSVSNKRVKYETELEYK